MRVLRIGRRIAGWSWRRKLAVAKTLPMLVIVRIGLRFFPLRAVLDRAEGGRIRSGERRRRNESANISSPTEDPSTRDLLWAIEGLGDRLFPGNPCLTQALVAQWLLRRRGWPAELRIGVHRKDPDLLAAHAWVVSGDEIVMGERGMSPDLRPFPPIERQSRID